MQSARKQEARSIHVKHAGGRSRAAPGRHGFKLGRDESVTMRSVGPRNANGLAHLAPCGKDCVAMTGTTEPLVIASDVHLTRAGSERSAARLARLIEQHAGHEVVLA